MAFVFYDTETTGLDTAFDQILTFAAIRTDAELREIDRFGARCQLLPYVVPSLDALLVNSIRSSDLFDSALPSHFEMMCAIRQKLAAWSPAVFIGYNSFRFDEHLLRRGFYKSLLPPYLTNTSGNMRADALRLLHSASLFAKGSISLPISEEGLPGFSLELVAPLNGFAHSRAHTAIGDVEAMLHLCRITQDRAPEIWSSFMRFSNKASVVDHVTSESIFALSELYGGRPYSWVVTNIGSNPLNSSEHYVYDLSFDPAGLQELSDEELRQRFVERPRPVRRLHVNAGPVIAAAEDAPEVAAAKTIPIDELERRMTFVRDDAALRDRLIRALEATQPIREPSKYPEQQLYEGFFTHADEALMAAFHNAPWDRRPELVAQLGDRRLWHFGRRLIFIERPELLSDEERVRYERGLARRIMDADAPWLTIPAALEMAEQRLDSCTPEQRSLVAEYVAFLRTRAERATAFV